MKQKKSLLKKCIGIILASLCTICILMSNSDDTYVNAENMKIKEVLVTFAPALKLGDINLDGRVDLSDAQLALNASLKIVELSPKALIQGDINGNGYVDQSDAQSILRMALALQ